MISAIKGSIFDILPGELFLDTGYGFIVKVLYPVSNFSNIGRKERLLLYTVLKVKDDDVVLYGFLTKEERALFEKLVSISGVGGKTALSFISAFSVNELIEAINSGDTLKISSIPGIGKKTAQRIILELTGKLELHEEQNEEIIGLKKDLVSGIINLGYPSKNVREFVNKTIKENPEKNSFEELFKLLLKKISKS